MPEIHTSVDVDAPPEVVWSALADVDRYPEWNPHLVRAVGSLAEGESLSLWVHQSGRTSHIDVDITECIEPQRLQWVGRFGARVLFEGTHTFELEPLNDGKRTRVRNHERSRGLLVPLVVRKDARDAYEAMNAALKERVETATEENRPPVPGERD
jgi:hypothetical protein